MKYKYSFRQRGIYWKGMGTRTKSVGRQLRHLGISITLPSCPSSATRMDVLPAQNANSRKGVSAWSVSTSWL